MASGDIKNPPVTESKSAKKKKAKAIVAAERNPSPAPAATTDKDVSASPNDVSPDVAGEHAHISELRKRLRNVNKKLINANKIGNLVAEHPDKAVHELVALKIINKDQKAQYEGIPDLEDKLQQLGKQIETLQEVEKDYKLKLSVQEKNFSEQLEKETSELKAELTAELKKEAAEDSAKILGDSLLILSQFLRLAAARRAEESEAPGDENQALEGVLLHVYAGDESAVATMLKLVNGSEEPTVGTSDDVLQTTFAHVRELAMAYCQPMVQGETASSEQDAGVESKEEPSEPSETDATIAHAGLTEIEEGSAVPLTNGHVEESGVNGVLANAQLADGAANAVGETLWEPANDSHEMSMSQEWVEIKVPEAEKVPTANHTEPILSGQSWADDQPDVPVEMPAADNDGFNTVQRNNRGNREGGWRGRGGGYRGSRGDGRGRGARGGRGRGNNSNNFRGGPRRSEES